MLAAPPGDRVAGEGRALTPIIRQALAEDLPRLLELYAQLDDDHADVPAGQSERPRSAFEDVRLDARQALLVAEVDGRVAGTLTLIILPNITHNGAPYAIAENIVVDAPMRGRGIGAALLRRAAEDARVAGCYKLSLASRLTREGADRFYERMGFVTTQRAFRLDL
jgi:GNAT superfamily N-acetyltransferase